MGHRSVITLTTAPAGSGKSYRRCAHFLVKDFLPRGDGVHISNFPVHVDAVAEAVALKTGRDPDALRRRIQLLDPAWLKEWEAGRSGPWETFKATDLQGCHIAIDEIHNFCGANASGKVKQKWQEWLGEIRHRGATVEFISQDPSKIAKEIQAEAAVRLSLVNSEERRDPWFSVLFADWYELRAKFMTDKYLSCVWELEYRKVDGRWRLQDKRIFPLDPYYFQFYDSYSAPVKGGVKGQAEKREWEKRSHVGLLLWFLGRNWFRLLPRVAFVCVFMWVCFLGGGGRLMSWFTSELVGMAKATAHPAAVVPVSAPGPVVAPGASAPVVGPDVPTSQPTTRPGDPSVQVALAELRDEAERERAKRVEVESRLRESFALVLLSQDCVTFRNGYSYRVGEMVDFGPFAGKSIAAIDWARRSVRLSDGTILRMGKGAFVGDASLPGPGVPSGDEYRAKPGEAGVRGGVPGAGGDDPGASRPVGRGAEANPVSGRNASRSVPPVRR